MGICMEDVAQWVERQIVALMVAGSNPAFLPNSCAVTSLFGGNDHSEGKGSFPSVEAREGAFLFSCGVAGKRFRGAHLCEVQDGGQPVLNLREHPPHPLLVGVLPIPEECDGLLDELAVIHG